MNSLLKKSAGPHFRLGYSSGVRPHRRRSGLQTDHELHQDDTIQLVGFSIGNRIYGTDIMGVREILLDPVIETCEDAPDFIQGIARVRGEIIPIIDLKKRLGDSGQKKSDTKNWVLVGWARGWPTGYIVDSVTRILKTSPDTILPAPDLILQGMGSSYIRGVCTADKQLFVVLEFEQMLSIDEARALENMTVQPRP